MGSIQYIYNFKILYSQLTLLWKALASSLRTKNCKRNILGPSLFYQSQLINTAQNRVETSGTNCFLTGAVCTCLLIQFLIKKWAHGLLCVSMQAEAFCSIMPLIHFGSSIVTTHASSGPRKKGTALVSLPRCSYTVLSLQLSNLSTAVIDLYKTDFIIYKEFTAGHIGPHWIASFRFNKAHSSALEYHSARHWANNHSFLGGGHVLVAKKIANSVIDMKRLVWNLCYDQRPSINPKGVIANYCFQLRDGNHALKGESWSSFWFPVKHLSRLQ